MLMAGGRAAEAKDAFEEGIRLLSPAFLRLPERRPIMRALAANYSKCCANLGEVPDASLVRPIQAALAAVQGKGS